MMKMNKLTGYIRWDDDQPSVGAQFIAPSMGLVGAPGGRNELRPYRRFSVFPIHLLNSIIAPLQPSRVLISSYWGEK